LVLSRLDYCNSLLFGLPASTLAPLLRVQNVAARLVLRLDHRPHIKPALQRLYWLPVKARIQFNIATMMHAILNQLGPAFLSNILKLDTKNLDAASSVPLQPTQLVMRTRTHFEKRVFFVCGPRFLPTSGTFILLQLFAKLLRLICYRKWSRHCNALSVSLLYRTLLHLWL